MTSRPKEVVWTRLGNAKACCDYLVPCDCEDEHTVLNPETVKAALAKLQAEIDRLDAERSTD